jgi:hypothetical protein
MAVVAVVLLTLFTSADFSGRSWWWASRSRWSAMERLHAATTTTVGVPRATLTPSAPPPTTPAPTTAAPTTAAPSTAAPTTAAPPTTAVPATVAPSPAAATSTDNTVSNVLFDMDGPHEGPLHGVPSSYSWAQHGVVVDPTDSQNCAALTGWGLIYADANAAEPAGVRVEIKDMESYVFSRSQQRWVRVQATTQIDGGHFAESLSGNASIAADLRTEADGGTSSAMPGGYNLHFWPVGGRASVTPGDIAAEYTTYRVRLIGASAGSAKYLANAGADWWTTLTAPYGTGSNNPPVGQGRFVYLSTNWQSVNFWSGGVYGPSVYPPAWSNGQMSGSNPPLDAMGTT